MQRENICSNAPEKGRMLTYKYRVPGDRMRQGITRFYHVRSRLIVAGVVIEALRRYIMYV